MADEKTFDIAIIGGGLAGLCLAIQSAGKGYSTILFEKEKYPFHKVCGEYISLESWDFLSQQGVPLHLWNLPIIKNVSNKLVQLNQFLKQKNEQLEQSNHELASFSYVASHDLQEPLRKIQTFVSRIMEKEYESLSPQGTEYFKRTDLAAKRMQRLIDDLLTFSRTNTQPKNFKEVDLNQILEEVKSEIKETIDEKNATIHSVILPVATVINFQFHQLIENLLLNALKYNKPGIPPQITITCSRYEGTNGHLVKGTYYQIDFKDNGIGFEQQYHNKIFELFQRLHGKSEYPGSGLGLAICKRIMQNHKGAITAQGVPGEGSTFTVYLPVNE